MTDKPLYFKQLDGLRFVAVFLVLIDHWLADRNVIPLGPLGVTLFFVLSGFLITGILVKSKLKDEAIGRSHWFSFKQFYIRRSLRIFPIYYLSVFVLMALASPSVQGKEWWHLLYGTNLYIAIKQTWLGITDHFWSLAVEEQFYLFFPLLIFLTPKPYLKNVLIGLILCSVLLRLALWQSQTNWVVQYVSMPTSLDAFGLGALLAYFSVFQQNTLTKNLQKNHWLWLSVGLWVLVILAEKTLAWGALAGSNHNFFTEVPERLAGSFLGFCLIARAVVGFEGAMKWSLENPVSNYLGRISYGLYLYHNFVYNEFHTPSNHVTLRIWHKLERIFPFVSGQIVVQLCLWFGLTVLLATVSWYCIEKPINGLKKYFEY